MNQTNNNNQSPKNVVMVATESIKSTSSAIGIYQTPENYDSIKQNILCMGLITPLIVDVNSNEIISGNLRHQIAIELDIKEVPVIFQHVDEDVKKKVSISSNVFRQKSSIEILRELKYFDNYFGIKKGQRSDLDPKLKEMKVKREVSLKGYSKDKRIKLKSIDKMATELFGADSAEYIDVFNGLDKGIYSLSGIFKNLDTKIKLNQNKLVIPELYNYSDNNATIFCKTSEDMSDIEDSSIQTICVSPPYFNMRDYNTGKEQMGLESTGDKFIENLSRVFKEAYRVLKPDGSLFVNLNDCCIDGSYQAIPQKFVLKMIEMGWILNDELIWIKNSANYSRGNRSVRNHEPIFHFVKSKNFKYNFDWMENLVDENNAISCGTNAKYPKLFSGLDYLINDVMRGNASSTASLRKECALEGFHLTHSATFPLSIPAICILMTSKPGDKVLDCFNGTGTTGEAAIALGRTYYGYETNPEYVMASEVRINKLLTEEYQLAA